MRILMLGNSLTTANDLPLLLGEKLSAEYFVHARGGARLAEHLNPSTILGVKTQRALADGKWDYIVLQESSNGPIAHRARFLEVSEALCRQIHEIGATPVFFETWAYSPSCRKLEKTGLSREKMHELLSSAYLEAARRGSALIAEVGQSLFNSSNSEKLYRADGVHLNVEGTALAANVLAECIIEGARGQRASSGSRKLYKVYMLRCADGSLYTGITTDIERRFQEHMSRGSKAARYTRAHPVVSIEVVWEVSNRSLASSLERRIKGLSHGEKETLVENPELIEAFY